VHFGQEIIEVATFRALQGEEEHSERVLENGRILRDNAYGSIEEDAFRRDFTVNALYYNISDFSVVDFVGGMDDHKASMMRLIGDPEQRYRETRCGCCGQSALPSNLALSSIRSPPNRCFASPGSFVKFPRRACLTR